MPNAFFSNTEKNKYIKQYLSEQLAKYKKINYVYAVLNKRDTDDIIIISDLSDEIIKNYIDKKIQHIDPVIIKALNQFWSFSWNEDIKIKSILSAKEAFNSIKNLNISGYAFVLHDHLANLAILSLYIDKSLLNDLQYLIDKNKNDIQGILNHTHKMFISLYQSENTDNKITFSPRESEVLYWCSVGKTYYEISIILGIKLGTVKFHIGNVVKKLGVTNAKHAISLSTKLNLVSYPLDKDKS